MPITPVQILWVNMVCSITLGIALAFEPPEKDADAAPRATQRRTSCPATSCGASPSYPRYCARHFRGLPMGIGQGADIEVARTASGEHPRVFEVFYLFGVRHIHSSVLNFEGIFGNRVVLAAALTIVVAQLLYTYVPLSHTLFGTASLNPAFWAVILAVAAIVFVVVEMEKVILARIRFAKTS